MVPQKACEALLLSRKASRNPRGLRYGSHQSPPEKGTPIPQVVGYYQQRDSDPPLRFVGSGEFDGALALG